MIFFYKSLVMLKFFIVAVFLGNIFLGTWVYFHRIQYEQNRKSRLILIVTTIIVAVVLLFQMFIILIRLGN